MIIHFVEQKFSTFSLLWWSFKLEKNDIIVIRNTGWDNDPQCQVYANLLVNMIPKHGFLTKNELENFLQKVNNVTREEIECLMN